MKRINTSRELYCEILKSFYFGTYRLGDKLMTYREAHEYYGLAKNTIGAAYDMLYRDGFICTNGAKGTIVTFDLSNPSHIGKVPLEWPSAGSEDRIPYEVAMRLHAHSLYTGLTHSGKEQLEECKAIVEDILQRVKGGLSHYEQVFKFWTCVILSLDNEFLSRIVEHFISRYIYLLPPANLSSEQRSLIGDSALDYYEFLLEAIERCDFEEFPARFERHYHNYYRYGGVVFSKLEDGSVFKEQALYESVLEDICVRIVSGEIKKGDNLPTTKRLCAEYGVSATTVNRTYGILLEMGFISRHVRSGTKLIAEPGDAGTWKTLETIAGLHKRDWKDAVEALIIMNKALGKRIAIEPDIVQQMRAELTRQHHFFECYDAPFFVSRVLLGPLIASLPAGVLHQYYVEATDALNRVITLCSFRVTPNKELGGEIYQLMCDALDELESGNQQSYLALSERVLLKKLTLLTEDYARATGGINNN